ncbi:hypothetical protein ACIBG7_38180 [Nonomuraea sp. NPDC050328]|uniref:hypothetical protein n=1 Tax=Nonomuraea sp. NPDC050328 TaxID=3364361 RepID=UPI0037917C77
MITRLSAAAAVALLACGLAAPATAATTATATNTAKAAFPELPGSGAGPAGFAYLCGNAKDIAGEPTGACTTWRLVAKDGTIHTVPEALGWEQGKDWGDRGAFAISPDGTRIAFQRAADDTVVVRDLASGETWSMPYKVRASSVGSPFTLKFVRDGSQLAITTTADAAQATLVQVETGKARKFSKGFAVLDADPGSGRVTLHAGRVFRTLGDGRPVSAKIPEYAGKHLIWGAFAARDGRAANLVPKDPPACGPDTTPVWLTTFDTRTGAMKKVRPRLPADVYQADVVDWLNGREIVVSAGRERPGKKENTVVGSYVYVMDVRTGAADLVAKLSTRERVFYATMGGYATPRSTVAAGPVAKAGKRGCE